MAVKTAKLGQGHTAGIFADMTLDGPEIGTLVAVVDRARHLPNRKTMGKQDPYCAMRLGKEAKKTETDRRGGQTPKWDQELRFTVHESPDYYRMKCSVFNDDKKTDMIGEAWLDLKEVIVPGGGQNDLWHPLFFKGKSAGEIRVEMTYYDSRPQDESVLEKKREKERRQQGRHGSPSAGGVAGGPRQLGPREAVKRRPLPAGPGIPQQAPMTGPPTSESDRIQPPQPYRSLESESGRSQTAERIWNHPDDFGNEYTMSQTFPAAVHVAGGYPAAPQSLSSTYQDHERSDEPVAYPQDGVWQDDFHQYSETGKSDERLVCAPANYRHSPEEEGWNNAPPPLTPRSYQTHSPVSIASSPPGWSSPSSVPSIGQSPDPRIPAPHQRQSISPVKLNQYRDSPLRQSMTQYDNHASHAPYQSSTDDQPPPPPPAHGASFGHSGPIPTPPQTQPQRVSPLPTPERSYATNPSALDRSPLQALERNYDPSYYSQFSPLSPLSPNVQSPPVAHNVASRARSYDDYVHTDVRKSVGNENFRPTRTSGGFFADKRLDEPLIYGPDRRSSYEPPGLYKTPQNYGSRGRQQQHRLSMQNEPQVYHSQAPVIRPRAISPNTPVIPQRKSVSPHPVFENGRRPVSGVPFGPDAYDSFNPSLDLPPMLQSENPEQLKEEARQREVEKIRDDSPIVGNDGRIIDPSDHLPADTWAPEYQRNNRKPEHVIRIRTKEERMASSPASARPLSVSTTPQSLNSPVGISPTKDGRNRLQKQMPNRPLPVQPFQHSHSSPAVTTVRSQEPMMHDLPAPSRPDFPQQSHYSTPSPRTGMPPRPSLSEYSLNNVWDYGDSSQPTYDSSRPPPRPRKEPLYPPRQDEYSSPRGPSYAQGRTPPRPRQEPYYGAPQQDRFMNPRAMDSSAMDPLSAELSTIDIGPRRGGRTAARFGRGY